MNTIHDIDKVEGNLSRNGVTQKAQQGAIVIADQISSSHKAMAATMKIRAQIARLIKYYSESLFEIHRYKNMYMLASQSNNVCRYIYIIQQEESNTPKHLS